MVIGMKVFVAAAVGGMDVTVGEKVRLLVASVFEGARVGVIRFWGNASMVSAAAVFTLAIAIWIMF